MIKWIKTILNFKPMNIRLILDYLENKDETKSIK